MLNSTLVCFRKWSAQNWPKQVLILVSMCLANYVFAHSVQVQYCASCGGKLRLWVEHWHGTQDPSTTTMTIQIDINGTTSVITSAPGGGVLDMSFDELPGCTSPIQYASGCPNQENKYNDWVYYDFTGLPVNTPLSFTILSGNTVFTEDACGMYPVTVPFEIPTDRVADQEACKGQWFSSIGFAGSSSWESSNPDFPLPASGNGPIPSVQGNGESTTITYLSPCDSGSFELIGLPTPQSSFYTVDNSGQDTGVKDVCIGDGLQFVNQTIEDANGYGWNWSLDDQHISTERNENQVFTAAGLVKLELIATNSVGCADTIVDTLVVHNKPMANFVNPEICAHSTANLQSTSTVDNDSIVTWDWKMMDDQDVHYTTRDVSHHFQSPGVHAVSLAVGSSHGCADTASGFVQVNELPNIQFLGNSVCFKDTVEFVNSSTIINGNIVEWIWNFGDSASSNASDPYHVYDTNGQYQVNLHAKSDKGCEKDSSINIIVFELPVTKFATSAVCEYNPAVFHNISTISSGGLTGSWTFGDGSSSFDGWNSEHKYDAGVYQVTLTTTSDQGCSTSETNQLIIYDQPSADFSADPACFGAPTNFVDLSQIDKAIEGDLINNWQWDVDWNGTIDYSSQNPNHVYAQWGDFRARLEVITAFGCRDTFESQISVWSLPNVDFEAEPVCHGEAVIFQDKSLVEDITGFVDGWQWNFGDGNITSEKHPTHIYDDASIFSVTLAAETNNGCTDSISKLVHVNPRPMMKVFSDNREFCGGDCAEIVNNSFIQRGNIADYYWSFLPGDTIQGSVGQYCFENIRKQPLYFDFYCKAISDEGCVSDTLMDNYFTVFPQVIAEFKYNPSKVTISNSVVLFDNQSLATDSTSWSWNFGNGDYSDSENPRANYNDTGSYTVELFAENEFGCWDRTNDVITVYQDALLYCPNTFTPNADGHNDYFAPQGFGVSSDNYNMFVYNRWGDLVFSTTKLFGQWDGLFNNELAQMDTYIVKIYYQDVHGGRNEFDGIVNLIR